MYNSQEHWKHNNRMIARRQREGERDIEREGEIREIERERGERDREVKGIER